LQILRDGKLVDFDPGTRREPEFYLVYFGADWCPPCRAFSPTLVAEYSRLQRLAPGRFEVVFISSDHSNGDLLKYAKHAAMPWPILKFSQLGRAEPLERWAARGIPCLVAVTAEGDALFHSYHGEEYVGPTSVLREFEGLLRTLDDKSSSRRRALHRLAVLQHLRAAAGASRPAAPYVISLDLRRYQTLELEEITAKLALNEKGEVTDAAFEPRLPTVLDFQLVKDAATWLFLPAVENGQAVRQNVQLPIKLKG
jgi:thiol-disulfide isomerase/thioredoxin